MCSSDLGGHGFNWRGPVRFYLELMFMLGSYFDTDPQLPTWASNVLGDQDADQLRRAEMLYEGTIEFLDQVSGPGHRNALDALSRLAQIAEQPPPVFGENFSDGLLRLMREVYPEKYDYVGEQPHRVLVERGTELADSYEIASHRGITLFCVLMFAIGHGFHKDPLYPWIARTLGDNRIDDPDKRAFRLESRARTYLNHVLKNLNVA